MDRLLHVLGVVVAARAERHGPSVFTGVRCGCGARWLLHLLVSHVRIDHRWVTFHLIGRLAASRAFTSEISKLLRRSEINLTLLLEEKLMDASALFSAECETPKIVARAFHRPIFLKIRIPAASAGWRMWHPMGPQWIIVPLGGWLTLDSSDTGVKRPDDKWIVSTGRSRDPHGGFVLFKCQRAQVAAMIVIQLFVIASDVGCGALFPLTNVSADSGKTRMRPDENADWHLIGGSVSGSCGLVLFSRPAAHRQIKRTSSFFPDRIFPFFLCHPADTCLID